MRIEEGKYYRTRDGRKVGPMRASGRTDMYKFSAKMADMTREFTVDGLLLWQCETQTDLMAEWTEGPVVTETVTKTRIVPGTYDYVVVGPEMDIPDCHRPNVRRERSVEVSFDGVFQPDELDAAAAVLSALAKGLRDA